MPSVESDVRKKIAPCSDLSVTLSNYGCIHMHTHDVMQRLIANVYPRPPSWHTWPEVFNMPRKGNCPPVSRDSIEEMIQLVRENPSLYDATSADNMDSTIKRNICHSIDGRLLTDNPDMTGGLSFFV